jgi:hypothetical protein
MQLAAPDGQSIELVITGYQFPDRQTEEYDSNWLQIEGRVQHPNGGWTFRDPCLLTYEVASLADWLDRVGSGSDAKSSIGFLEPNLSLELLTSSPHLSIRVYFHLESRPPWAPRGHVDDDDVWVEIPVAELDFRRASQSLRDQLRRFPQRAVR